MKTEHEKQMEALAKSVKTEWQCRVHDLFVRVSLHAVGEAHTPQGQGIYCYYIYTYESVVGQEKFKELWLEDEVFKYRPDAEGRITHDYYSLPILKEVDFHGGATFYAKNGHTEGYRSVEIGCDYNHGWNQDNPPSFERVCRDALQTAEQVAQYFNK